MKTAKQVLILIGIAVLIAGSLNLIHPERIPWVEDWGNRVEARAVKEGVALVQLSEVLEFLRADSHLLVDARPGREYERGHFPSAVSLPFESMDAEPEMIAQLLAAEKPLIVYCSGVECEDNLLLAIALREMGREEVSIFIGGMDLWRSEMLAVEGEVQ